ncbi:MAG: hypothetical protein HDS84_06605 [Bacteroidales bacterium]|nr:hypothetical protein [Bacteroidales bacterium]
MPRLNNSHSNKLDNGPMYPQTWHVPTFCRYSTQTWHATSLHLPTFRRSL